METTWLLNRSQIGWLDEASQRVVLAQREVEARFGLILGELAQQRDLDPTTVRASLRNLKRDGDRTVIEVEIIPSASATSAPS